MFESVEQLKNYISEHIAPELSFNICMYSYIDEPVLSLEQLGDAYRFTMHICDDFNVIYSDEIIALKEFLGTDIMCVRFGGMAGIDFESITNENVLSLLLDV